MPLCLPSISSSLVSTLQVPAGSTESMGREVNRDDAWSQPGSLTITSALSVFNIAAAKATFVALKQAFGNQYIYAGVGTSLRLESSTGAGERRGERPALEEDDLITYRKLARREDPFGLRAPRLP